jgi:hypothetical protein
LLGNFVLAQCAVAIAVELTNQFAGSIRPNWNRNRPGGINQISSAYAIEPGFSRQNVSR